MAQNWTAMMLDKERLLNGSTRIPGHKGTSVGIPCLRDGITHNSLSCVSVAFMGDKANG